MIVALYQNATAVMGAVAALLLACFALIWQKRSEQLLPPLASLSHEGVTKCLVDGSLHRYVLNSVSELGLVFRLREQVGTAHHFIVCDSALARLVLEGEGSAMPPGEKRNQIKLLNKITMDNPNIVTKKTHGEGWDWARKGVAPAFSKTNLLKALPEIQRKTAEFTDILDLHITESKVLTNVTTWMVKLTIDFISTTMFGTDFQTMKHADNEESHSDGNVYLIHLPLVIMEYVIKQTNDIIRRLMFWSECNKEARNSAGKVEKVGQTVLDRYRGSHTKEEILADTSIIGYLTRSPYPSDAHRVADITIFMLAGHDTTAHQITWIIIELARHPLVVAKLRQELDRVLDQTSGPRNCSSQQLSELTYLGKVIKEGMRLRPVVANGSQREVLVDIPYKGYVIPKGSSIAINFFTMFRVGIKDGDKFIPERWNEDNPDYSKLNELFMPFSSGRRNCIGQSLALLELKLVLATMYYSYDFEIIGNFMEVVSLTMKPENLNLKVSKRVK